MALHGLESVTIGVPDVPATSAYYMEFGLTPHADGWLTTTDGGRQLRLVRRERRQLVEMVVRAESREDVARVAASLARLGVSADVDSSGEELTTFEPIVGHRTVVKVSPLLQQDETPRAASNGPGRLERRGRRAEGVLRTTPVHPNRLGHAVLGTTNFAVSMDFYVKGLGFKVSDYISDKGVFLRCSSDHHNVLIFAAPMNFLHHTAWQVTDVDEIGRGATHMLSGHPERHVWGLGRHHAGSNFFWYLNDPAGNFCEYFADMDGDIDERLWQPEVIEGAKGLFNWGPPPPPSFLCPDDVAEMMIDSHSA